MDSCSMWRASSLPWKGSVTRRGMGGLSTTPTAEHGAHDAMHHFVETGLRDLAGFDRGFELRAEEADAGLLHVEAVHRGLSRWSGCPSQSESTKPLKPHCPLRTVLSV